MSAKLLNTRFSSLTLVTKRFLAIRSDSDVANRMKIFNQQKKYQKTIELFHEHKQIYDIAQCSSYITAQLLKACVQLNNVSLGKMIHHQISSDMANNPFVLLQLISLYMQTGNIVQAEYLFNSVTNPNIPIIGAMMKGYITNNEAKKAIDLFLKAEDPDDILYIILFNACAQIASKENLSMMKNISEKIPKSFYRNERMLASMINGFMKCHDVKRAESIFKQIKSPSLETIGAMMKGYIVNDQAKEAINLFQRTTNPDDILHIILFNACAQIASKEILPMMENISENIPKSFYRNEQMLNSTIDAFMKCHSVQRAESIFNETKNPSREMINVMMKGYIVNHQAKKAIDFFKRAKNPDAILYNLFFNACAQVGSKEILPVIENIWKKLPEQFHRNKYILTSIMSAFMKSNGVERAESILKQTKNPPIEMINTMMKGYIENNQAKKAIDLFQKTNNSDEVHFILFFKACAQIESNEILSVMRNISEKIPKSFYRNERILTSMIDGFMKCHGIEPAESIFKQITKPTIETVGAMMKGYIVNDQAKEAVNLFQRTKNSDDILHIIFFNACAQIASKEILPMMENISENIPKSFYRNERMLTSMIDAYMKCNHVQRAESIFNETKNPSNEMINAMMKGYIVNHQAKKAIDFFKNAENPDAILYNLFFNACAQIGSNEMLNLMETISEKIPKSFYQNERMLTSMIDAFMKYHDVRRAEFVFKQTKNPSIEMINAMMKGYIVNDQELKTIDLYMEMKANKIEFSKENYLLVMKALSKYGDESLAESITEEILEKNVDDIRIQTALIDVWGKCGSVRKAEKVFEELSDKDVYTYGAMVNAYGLNGMGKQAVQLYRRMSSESIDEITHICVLNACSHSGLIDDARAIFEKISVKTESIFTTMTDCFSRAGLFEEAQNLINIYEKDHQPSLIMHMSLLSGARNAKDTHRAQEVFNQMKKRFPQSEELLTSGVILLSNTYGLVGDIEKANIVRTEFTNSGFKKEVGLTRVMVNRQGYQFRAHDQSHPRSAEIHAESRKLSNEIIQHGYRPNPSWVTRPLNDGETIESVLCGHSERLAIAWCFVVNPKIKQIQITKNLRVCGDCHEATKYIAKIRQCEIRVRDANRMHRFTIDGHCSCNDYF